MTDLDDGSPWGWLDMSRYPDLDPDQAVPDSVVGLMRDFLLGHEVAPLPDQAWDAALGAALLAHGGDPGTAPGTDVPGHGTGDGTGDEGAHPGPWLPDDLAGGHGDALPGPLLDDAHTNGDPHFGGGHW
jgi:hypothetical protein